MTETSIPGSADDTRPDDDAKPDKRKTDGAATTTYHYDHLNRLIEEDQPGGVTIGYGYDPDGNLASVTDSSGTTGYTYTAENEVSSLLEPGASVPIRFDYNKDGNRVQTEYPNGIYECVAYDNAPRVTIVQAQTGDCSVFVSSPIGKFAYGYTAGGLD